MREIGERMEDRRGLLRLEGTSVKSTMEEQHMSEFQSKDEADRVRRGEDDTDVEGHKKGLIEDDLGDEAGRVRRSDDDGPEVEGHKKG
jgi:hypothetical protein